jgi:DNA-binding transcriptional MerR regulator
MLQVGEISRRLGLNPQTLYFYERIGLIPKPKRTRSGYRLFTEQDVERLSFIDRAKALGLTLNEIQEILALQDGHALPCHEVRERLLNKADQIKETITRLQELHGELLSLVGCCENNLNHYGSVSDCTTFRNASHEA